MQFDSNALVRRPDAATSPLGDSGGLVVVGTYRCKFVIERDNSMDKGAGDFSYGRGICFFYTRDITPKHKDVITITRGLEIGTMWAVMGVIRPKRGLVMCEVEAYDEAGD